LDPAEVIRAIFGGAAEVRERVSETSPVHVGTAGDAAGAADARCLNAHLHLEIFSEPSVVCGDRRHLLLRLLGAVLRTWHRGRRIPSAVVPHAEGRPRGPVERESGLRDMTDPVSTVSEDIGERVPGWQVGTL